MMQQLANMDSGFWKEYRVPDEMRHEFLCKVYRKRLVHNHKKQDEMFKVFMSAYKQQIELVKYLRSLGADEVRYLSTMIGFGDVVLSGHLGAIGKYRTIIQIFKVESVRYYRQPSHHSEAFRFKHLPKPF